MSRIITFDGLEISGPDKGLLVCPIINVWYNYDDRTAAPAGGKPVVTKVRHKEKGTLLEQRSDGACKIRTMLGVEGWLTSWFIKELK